MNLYIDDKKSTIKDISLLLGLKSHELPLSDSRPKTFERIGVKDQNGNYKIDPQSKKAIIPSGLSIPMTFDAQTPDGGVVKITYSARQSVVTNNGISRMKYDNKMMTLPKDQLMVSGNEKNLVFFLFISTKNLTSPLNIGKANPNCDYKYLDSEATARLLNEKEDILIEALSTFKSLGEAQIKTLAKGYKLSSNIDDLSIEEVKTLLRNKVKQDPAKFNLDIQSHEVALDGTIQDAIDKQIITSRNSTSGFTWILNGIDLVETPNNNNPIPSLRTVILGNMDEYFPMIKDGIQKRNVAASPKIDAKHFSDFIGDGNSSFDAGDRKLISQLTQEERRIVQLREWAKLDLNDPSIHHATKRAIENNKKDIEEQRQKDIAEGLIKA